MQPCPLLEQPSCCHRSQRRAPPWPLSSPRQPLAIPALRRPLHKRRRRRDPSCTSNSLRDKRPHPVPLSLTLRRRLRAPVASALPRRSRSRRLQSRPSRLRHHRLWWPRQSQPPRRSSSRPPSPARSCRDRRRSDRRWFGQVGQIGWCGEFGRFGSRGNRTRQHHRSCHGRTIGDPSRRPSTTVAFRRERLRRQTR